MCGIVGIVSGAAEAHRADLESALEVILHRGPDDEGIYSEASAGILLGHRRLSIQDLSPQGRQPMRSSSGRYVLVYNGEIYNFLELASELRSLGQVFKGSSDTEVMLAAFECWGVEKSLQRFNGMFAFAVWDSLDRKITLVRDRVGIKPLYFGFSGENFLFSSELKALREFSFFNPSLSQEALSLYSNYGYIPAPHSVYQGIFKLAPASFVELDIDKLSSLQNYSDFRPKVYWSNEQSTLETSGEEALTQFQELITDSVALRMRADVPYGVFLSGGLDSSLIAALMTSLSSSAIKTFTIGFDEADYDESAYARAISKQLGTEHSELVLSESQVRDVIPELANIFDEPFSDSSQIPSLLVSKLAREQVAVCLAGDGADELFCGYNRYIELSKLWKSFSFLPKALKLNLAKLIKGTSPRIWEKFFSLLAIKTAFDKPEERVYKVALVLAASSIEAAYESLLAISPERSLGGSQFALKRFEGARSIEERLMRYDQAVYLPDDLLTKLDRVSMSVSLESRVPFLDHRMLEFAATLPLEMKLRDGRGKFLVRSLLNEYLSPKTFERPKMGFSVPVGVWLRGPLKDWAQSLLGEKELSNLSGLSKKEIESLWQEHDSEKRNRGRELWNLLMLSAWYRRWVY